MNNRNKKITNATKTPKLHKYDDYYVKDKLSYKEIAKRFGLNQSSLRRRGSLDNWKEKRKKYATKQQQKDNKRQQVREYVGLRATAENVLKKVDKIKEKDEKRISDIQFLLSVVNVNIRKLQLNSQSSDSVYVNPKDIEIFVKAYKELVMLERLVDGQPTTIERTTQTIVPDAEFEEIERQELALIEKDHKIKELEKKIKQYTNTNNN